MCSGRIFFAQFAMGEAQLGAYAAVQKKESSLSGQLGPAPL